MPHSVGGPAEMAGISGHGMAEFGGRCRRNWARWGVALGSSLSDTFLHGTRAGRNSLGQTPATRLLPCTDSCQNTTPHPHPTPELKLKATNQGVSVLHNARLRVLCERVLKIVSNDPSNAQGHVLKTNHTFKTAHWVSSKHTRHQLASKKPNQRGTVLIYRTSLWSNPLSHLSWLEMETSTCFHAAQMSETPFSCV